MIWSYVRNKMLSFLYKGNKISPMQRRSTIVILTKWFKGLLFCSLWYLSVCAGFLFLYCPLLPLLIIHQNLYRKITDVIFTAWEIYPAALLQCIFRTQIIVCGDAFLPNDAALIIMNHRTRLDWFFLWAAMFHACDFLAHKLKIVLKASIRHAPGPGWVMQMACFLYIHRRWERDKILLSRILDYYRDISSTCQILLFPEGTDLNDGSVQKSNSYANLHGLESYHYVLHPKTTGFAFLVQKMKQNGQLNAIYDLTVGYPHTLPQSEFEILSGTYPEEVHFAVRRFSGSSIPVDTDDLKAWLNNIWKEKEKTLENFYRYGSFSEKDQRICYQLNSTESLKSNEKNIQTSVIEPTVSENSTSAVFNRSSNVKISKNYYEENIVCLPEPLHTYIIYIALIFWTLFCFIGLYSVIMYTIVQIWAILNVSLFICLSFYSEGLNQLEVSLYQFKSRFFKRKNIACK